MFGLAAVHLHNGEVQQGISLLQTCAPAQAPAVLVVLGDYYLRGNHVPKEPRTAFLYLQEYTMLALSRPLPGNAMAVRWDLVLYPMCLLLGVGCDKDEKGASRFSTSFPSWAISARVPSSRRLARKERCHDRGSLRPRYRKDGPVKVLNAQEGSAAALPAVTGAGAAGGLPRVQQSIVSGPTGQRLSTFLQKSLIPDEKVMLIGEFPRVYTVDAVLRMLILSWLGLWASAKIPPYIAMVLWQILSHDSAEKAVNALVRAVEKWPYLPFYVMSFIGVWSFLTMMIVRWTTQIVLTDRRFLYKRGLLAVEMIQMNFWQIEHTDVTQSLLGTLLDYGRVVVQSYAIHQKEDASGDSGLLRLPNLKHPYMFTRVIEDHRRAPPLGYRQYTGPVVGQ